MARDGATEDQECVPPTDGPPAGHSATGSQGVRQGLREQRRVWDAECAVPLASGA